MEQNNKKDSDKIERMVWEIPTIEVLNFKQTHGGTVNTNESSVTAGPLSL